MESMRYIVFFLLILTAINAVLTQQTADRFANAKTKQIYAYIAGLAQQGKMLSGQFAGYSPGTFKLDQINAIQQQTGKIPAILGCDWASGWGNMVPPENIIDYSCNPSLKDHWNKGGLVTVNMHLPNPVSPNGGGYKDKMNLNFADLTNPQTSTGQRWRAFLDRMALGLNDLQQAGVTVIFRPLHEMNGDWFYWCDQDPAVYKNVWIHMFNYLTQTKNIHNTIWVYSPDQSRANPSRYYPGDAYVDIVGLDVYTDEPNNMNGYNEMMGLNKPFALAEVGPSTTNGQFDYTKWLSAIQNKFPRVAYFFAWNDGWSPITNKGAHALYTNSRVVNRGEINYSGSTPTVPSGGSTVIYSFSNGIGQWKGVNVKGGPWQSNEFVIKSTDGIKADVQFTNGGQYGFFSQDPSYLKLSGYNRLVAYARVAAWGLPPNPISAKLYVKVGSAWTWYDSGAVQLNSNAGTSLTIDLTKINQSLLSDVKEIGITYMSNGNGGSSAIYFAHISAEK